MGAVKNYFHDEICATEEELMNQQDDYPTAEECRDELAEQENIDD